MRTEMHRGVNHTRASGGRWHQCGWHGRERFGMRGRLCTGGPIRLVGETGKRLGLFGVFTRWLCGRGGPLRHRNTLVGPSVVQYDKQPQESQDQELIVKEVWNQGSTPLHDGVTEALYSIP